MLRPVQGPAISVGDPVPRIVLALAAGGRHDSWDPRTAGLARVYWIGPPLAAILTASFAERLAGWEMLLHVVTRAPPLQAPAGSVSWIVDAKGDLARACGTAEPAAVVIDAAGRMAALLGQPTPEQIAALAERLHRASSPAVVQAQAPVLLLERVADANLCRGLIDHWQRHDKVANTIDVAGGNVASADLKRRQDVPVDDPALFAQLRDALMRRIAPMILRAFHTTINVLEMPVIGCYDQASGGWFRRHRDNTTPMTANRQFAVSLNLNGGEEYDGGEVRFPEFGRELYRPLAGGALVFSCSLLHEVVPVTRGRRLGLFTFMSTRGRDPGLAAPPATGPSLHR